MTMSCDDVRDQAAGFVLGALTPAEEQAVRDHLASCPEAHAEVAELGEVVPSLAASVDQVEPPPALRERLLAAAAADLRARGDVAVAASSAVAAPAVAAPADGSAAPAAGSAPAVEPTGPARAPSIGRIPSASSDVVPFSATRARSRAPRLGWALGIAAALVIAALGVWNVRLQSQLTDAQAYQQRVDQVLAIARTPGGVMAVLASPTAAGQDGLVAIGTDGQAAMVVTGLPATTGNQVYEVWVIVGTNDPKPVGALSQSGGLAFMSGTPGPVPAGATVALTREPGPDPTAPTSAILVKGVVGPST
jgi:anti-sigma factor RsiW